MSSKRILAISGSIRPNSSSHVIIDAFAKLLPSTIEFSVYNELASIPAFDGREDDPEVVKKMKSLILHADGILICTPEYAFGVPGALKNALDWTVGTGEFVNKPVALITASSQGERGHEAMLHILTAIAAKLNSETTLLISAIRSKVKDGKLIDTLTLNLLKEFTHHFVHNI